MSADLIERPWRCNVTGNIVGTDTQMVGYTCDCQGCRAEAAISAKDTAISEMRAELERVKRALRDQSCPRPCNHRPDDFSIGDCSDAGECGCGAARALASQDEGEER